MEENYISVTISEVTIGLLNQSWYSILTNLKYTRIKRFRIRGRPLGLIGELLELDSTDMLTIVREAIRFKCDVFIFEGLDFKSFEGAQAAISLPVVSVHFEKCNNVKMFVSQVFNLYSNILHFQHQLCDYDQRHRVNDVTFSHCHDGYIELKRQVIWALERNYRFKFIRYIKFQNKSIYHKGEQDKLNCDTNKLLRRNLVGRLIRRDAIATLLGINRFRRKNVLSSQPRDIILIIAGMLWKKKEEYCNVLGLAGKLEGFDTEFIYAKSQLPRGNEESLTVVYNEIDGNSFRDLKELQHKKITLDKLIIHTADPIPDTYPDAIRFKLIPNLFAILIDTRTKLLEIYNMNFEKDTIMREPVEPVDAKETLNGDDSKIEVFRNMDYTKAQLTEIRLVRCMNILNFVNYLSGILNKRDIYYYTGLNLKDVVSSNVSLVINRKSHTINVSVIDN